MLEKTHFKVHSLLHKLCGGALGCRSRWLWWWTADSRRCSSSYSCSRQTGTFIRSRFTCLSFFFQLHWWMFSSRVPLQVICRACYMWDFNLAYSALNFTAFPAVTHFLTFPACCLCSVCSLSLSLSLSLAVCGEASVPLSIPLSVLLSVRLSVLLSVLPPVLPTLHHISTRKTTSVTGKRLQLTECFWWK